MCSAQYVYKYDSCNSLYKHISVAVDGDIDSGILISPVCSSSFLRCGQQMITLDIMEELER